MHREIVDSRKFHRALIIICVQRCIRKPIHLRSHVWQSSTAVLCFALKVTICYEQRSGHYLVLATVSSTYNIKNQKPLRRIYLLQKIKLTKTTICQ